MLKIIMIIITLISNNNFHYIQAQKVLWVTLDLKAERVTEASLEKKVTAITLNVLMLKCSC